MTKVIADITMSLDGFVTGPNPGPANGLGDGGEPLHTWVFDGDDVDAAVLQETFERSGAVVMGRGVFDVVDAPGGWSEEIGYGAHHVGTPPFFVVTHSAPDAVRLELDFTFVTDGLANAIERARSAAGDRDAVVMGGGNVIGQCVELGLVDELLIHLSPVVLGAGTPLFAGAPPRGLVQRASRPSKTATHLTYELDR